MYDIGKTSFLDYQKQQSKTKRNDDKYNNILYRIVYPSITINVLVCKKETSVFLTVSTITVSFLRGF